MTAMERQALALALTLLTTSAGLIWLGHRLTTGGTRNA